MEEAEIQFGATVALAPLNPRGYKGLGAVYWRQGDLNRAESTFKRGLSISPSDSYIRLALADLYAATGRTKEAVEEYESILAIESDNTDARLALSRLKSGDPDTNPSRP